MATVKTVLVKGRCNSRGAYPLAVQVLHKRKKKVFYTGYSITPCEFDSFSGRVLFNGAYTMETVRRMNRTCRKICKILDKAIGILEREGNEYTTCDIARVYETLTGKVGFYSYFRERIRVLFDTGHEGTAKAYEATLHSMQKHLCKTDFPFAHLSSRLVIKYRDTLLEAGVGKNTIGFYLHNMKAVYRRGCLELNLVFPSPFSDIRIRSEKTVKQSLPMNQVKSLANLSLSVGTPECLARDVFMFSIYTRGMSFVDIAFLKKSDIFPGVIRYRRQKTGQLLEIGINRQIQSLLERYGDTSGDYLFPLVDESETPYSGYKKAYNKIRYALKKISQRIDINIPLRLHAARHCWATMARENGTPLHTISECLGHSSEKVTRIYLKELDRSVLDEVNNHIADNIC